MVSTDMRGTTGTLNWPLTIAKHPQKPYLHITVERYGSSGNMLRRIDVGEALELMGDEVHEGGHILEVYLRTPNGGAVCFFVCCCCMCCCCSRGGTLNPKPYRGVFFFAVWVWAPQRPFTYLPVCRGFSVEQLVQERCVCVFLFLLLLFLFAVAAGGCFVFGGGVCLFAVAAGGGVLSFVLLLLPDFFLFVLLLFAAWAPTGSSLTCWFAGASAAEHNSKKTAANNNTPVPTLNPKLELVLELRIPCCIGRMQHNIPPEPLDFGFFYI